MKVLYFLGCQLWIPRPQAKCWISWTMVSHVVDVLLQGVGANSQIKTFIHFWGETNVLTAFNCLYLVKVRQMFSLNFCMTKICIDQKLI